MQTKQKEREKNIVWGALKEFRKRAVNNLMPTNGPLFRRNDPSIEPKKNSPFSARRFYGTAKKKRAFRKNGQRRKAINL